MISKKLAYLAAATLIGTAFIVSPVQARFGGLRGGGFAVAHVGGFGGGFVGRPAFVGRSAFIGRPGFFPGRRFAFLPHRRFISPFFGAGALYAGYSSCWTLVPTIYGWRRVWACGYPYGYDDGY
jgi:hypothetical protein